MLYYMVFREYISNVDFSFSAGAGIVDQPLVLRKFLFQSHAINTYSPSSLTSTHEIPCHCCMLFVKFQTVTKKFGIMNILRDLAVNFNFLFIMKLLFQDSSVTIVTKWTNDYQIIARKQYD